MTKDGKHFARIIETKMGYVIQQGEVKVRSRLDPEESKKTSNLAIRSPRKMTTHRRVPAIVPVPEASPAKGKAKKPPKKAAAAPEAAPGPPAKRQRRATSRD